MIQWEILSSLVYVEHDSAMRHRRDKVLVGKEISSYELRHIMASFGSPAWGPDKPPKRCVSPKDDMGGRDYCVARRCRSRGVWSCRVDGAFAGRMAMFLCE